VGGVARRATIINQERAAAEHSLLLDAGDSLLNDQDPAKSTLGSTSIEALNRMGYDAMTLGGLDIAFLTVADLQQRIAESKFVVLSANATVSATGELLAQPYLIREIADHRVAILGLTDPYPDTEILVSDPTEAAIKWVPELRKLADIVIILSHAGLDVDEKIAAAVPGIDIIVSGRNAQSSAPVVVQATGTVLFHADSAVPGTAGTHVGVAKLTFDAGGKLMSHEWQNALLDNTVVASPEMGAWITLLPQPSN
jgi:2',3'-cyclic-nucleotide 2'-phosphodiesterase (5'-nucleotidase family)